MRSQAILSMLLALALCVASPFAGATAQRTFVSAVGTDNPNCSIAAPCRSFAVAMNATSSGGEIIVLESAGYGPVTITKSVSIIAPPGIYGGISVASGLNGVTIDAPGATVVLRGLSINGQGGNYGILVQQAARVRIENCVVSKMGAVGVYHTAPGAEMVVLDTIVRDNTEGLGLVASNASIVMDRVHAEHNTNVGFYIAPVPGTFAVNASIADSAFVENGLHGIWADTLAGSPASGPYTGIQVVRSVIARNGHDGFRATAAAAFSFAFVTLRGNLVGRNGAHGIYALAPPPGIVNMNAADNAIDSNYAGTLGNGITAQGSGARVRVSGNSGIAFMECLDGATMISLGNNAVEDAFGACLSTGSGF
jgi:hypothetical protein